MEHGVSVILCLSSLPGNCWCDMAAREPASPMSTVHTLVNMHVMRWINQVGHISERWFSGQPDSFLNYVDKVSRCQESGQTDTHAAVTEVLSHTTVEVIENLSGTGKRRVWTYGHVILTLHVCPLTGRARGALVEHYGCCAVSDGGWCSKTHGYIQQEEGAQIRDSFCEREDGLTGRPRAGCVVIKAVWCSARRKYAQPWYNVSLRVCVFVCLHVD